MYTTPMPLAVPQQPTRIEPTSTLRVDILSPDLLLPLRDEDYVEVTLVRRGQDINSNVYRFRTPAGSLEKRGGKFQGGIDRNGNHCMVYYGKRSRIYYWTWSLDPESELVKVKEN